MEEAILSSHSIRRDAKYGIYSKTSCNWKLYQNIHDLLHGACQGGQLALVKKAFLFGADTLHFDKPLRAAARGNQIFTMHWLFTLHQMCNHYRSCATKQSKKHLLDLVDRIALQTFNRLKLFDGAPSNFVRNGAIRGGHIDLVNLFPEVLENDLGWALKSAVHSGNDTLIEK